MTATATKGQQVEFERQPSGVHYLSEFISRVPSERRVMFIKVLKESIRSGTFDGAPVAELFELAYSARGKAGIEERRKAYRDFVVDNNEAFAAWFEGQLTARKASGQFATRQQLEGGAVQVGDLAVKYRRRSGNQKRRAKR